MEQIKNIIEKVFADKNIDYENINIYDNILAILRRYVKNIERIDLQKNVLSIYIDSTVYRNELQMRKLQILEDLNNSKNLILNEKKIKDIKFLNKGRKI